MSVIRIKAFTKVYATLLVTYIHKAGVQAILVLGGMMR